MALLVLPRLRGQVILRDIMSRAVLTASPSESADGAWERMHEKRVHHLVVIKDREVIGVISDHDLGGSRRATSRRMGRVVGELMSSPVETATTKTNVRQAAKLMRGRSIGCLPVMEQGELLGIVTVADLLDLVAGAAPRAASRS